MLSNQIQIIFGVIIFVIITIVIWTIAIKSYKRTRRLDLRLNIMMNIVLPFIITLLLKLCLPTVYIVGENEKIDEFINIIGSSVEMSNAQKIIIKPFESTLVNNTSSNLFLEKIIYGNPSFTTYKETNVVIKPFTKQKTKSINFFFGTPPRSISVKNKTQSEMIWLHH